MRALETHAAERHGLLERDVLVRQATLSRAGWYRAIRHGTFEQVHPGVGRMFGSPRTPEQGILAAVLAAGDGALASHRSAARLWGIPRPDHDPIDVMLMARSRKASVAGAVIHRPRDHLDLNRVRRSSIPTTNVLRTLCDLGALDAAAVPGAVGHVVTTDLASPASLRAAVERHGRRGRAGVPALRDALDDWVIDGKPVDSILEPAMRGLIDRHKLPPVEFHPKIGSYEIDFRIIGSPILLECDGWATHGLSREKFERDRVRDADLTALGYVVLRFTYRAILKHERREARRIRSNVERWSPELLAA